jgi:predicted Zn finger-like uncharacterized protein
MIIVCEKCSARLQVDETKIVSRPFTVRCPKCDTSIEPGAASPAIEQSATALGGSPSTEDPRLDHPSSPAPLFELEPNGQKSDGSGVEKFAELLSSLMSQRAGGIQKTQGARPVWNPRRVLICVASEHRESAARNLAENNYQVFVAEDTKQAVDRMRENQLDVVILDPRFDPAEQGPVFITREVNVLRPAQRRRMFFVLLSPALRTMDTHAAFLNNVNAVINVKDIGDLPHFLDQRLREYNELYQSFNEAVGVTAL